MEYRRVDHVVDAEVGDQVVALDVEAGVYHHLNGTGAAIWNELKQPRTLDDVSQALRARFSAAPGILEKEVQSFIDELIGKGILQASEQPGA